MRRRAGPTFVHAGAGVLAASFGMALAHLVAALTDPAASPVLAVGSTVIDATPTPVKEWAVRHFGTADKTILIGNVLLVTLLAAALAGVLARRRLGAGLGLLGALVALAGAAALHRPDATPRDVVPSLVAAVGGLLALWWLARPRGPRTGAPEDTTAGPGASRRAILAGSGVLLLGGVVAAGAGQLIVRARSRIADIVLPRPSTSLSPLPTGLEADHPGISPFRTPNGRFYRVDTKLTVPIVDHRTWRLRVDGMVDRELSFSYDDLRDLAVEEHDITLTCVSNTVGGKLVGAARWLGVPVATLLDMAGPKAGADQVLSVDVDDFTISTPLAVLTDGRPALVAIGMNGEPLPRAHGFPARLVTPGLYGFVGATKWLARLTVTTYAEDRAYWTRRDWATDAPIKLSSRIDTPRPLSTIRAGTHAIGGVAWAQHNGVAKVEVRIDGGAWQPATLGPDAGVDYWRQWYLPWDARPGSHQLAVRATGRDGTVQTAVRASSFPAGSSGIQELVVNVT
ncbi:molybdopterin-dependent oxidoreductase [Nocardioides pocheonensis]|uniref:Oxidoreductase n=1 Tax=Nocardioides pocheonensis TaxID=661485 RepID=A0A3N0GTK3_9ACTN|nr:molybdopterin-dependent oxidoreductase [Nocardioides pocheonensis]RNM15721.1 oxidoreductase [Nocardioides pocheonensis]